MENQNMFLWGVTAAMATMSFLLLSGKGSWLIVGFNTSSAKKKEKYDVPKLCRTMGGGLSIITITLAISLCYNFQFPFQFIEYIVIGIFIISSISMLFLANTVCRKK